MVKGIKNSKGYEKSEDPLYVLENNLPIDVQYYMDHQIKLPILRLFEPILKSPEQELFVGEHTRNVTVPKIQANTGLGRFAVVKK